MKKLILLGIFPLTIFASFAQDTVSNICFACHGLKMEKSGIRVSVSINSLSKSNILKALKGYKYTKRNKYGSGNTMSEMVSDFSDNELEELSKYIPTLSKR